jgi:hypothetical protein
MQITENLSHSDDNSRHKNYLFLLQAFLIAIVPVVVTWLLITLHLHGDFSTYVPTFGSDPVGYWHYTLTFSHVGFNGGYYVPNEIPAPFSPIHFDVIGPVFPILYGSVAHFTGWGWTTGIIFNAILVTAALFLFIAILRPDRNQALLIALVSGTSWIFILYLPSMFQESIHIAVAIAAAAFFYQLLTRPSVVSPFLRLLAGLFIITAALLRPSWCVLLLPYFLLQQENKSRRAFLMALLKTVIITFIILQVLKYVSPPSNNSVLDSTASFQNGSFVAGFTKLFSGFATNIIWYGLHGLENPLNLLVITQVLVILAFQFRLAKFSLRQWRKINISPEVAFHLFNLGGIVLSGMFIYLAWGFDRVFTPHLILSALLLIAYRRYRLVAVLIGTNLLLIGVFLSLFSNYWAKDFASDPADYAEKQAEMASYIAYDSDAVTPWCNTLLLDVRLFDERVLSVPAGIGVSYVMRLDKLQFPLKSRYLLFNSSADQDLYASLKPHLNAHLLAHLPAGDLYINDDAQC